MAHYSAIGVQLVKLFKYTLLYHLCFNNIGMVLKELVNRVEPESKWTQLILTFSTKTDTDFTDW